MRILVVDDEPGIVQMCVRVLQAKGHTVEGHTRAQDALDFLGRETADLLVVDYKMPELTGLDFIKRAWALRPGMRVVLITAHGTREVMTKASETGIQTVVLKPFTPSELVEGVAAAIADPAAIADSPPPGEP